MGKKTKRRKSSNGFGKKSFKGVPNHFKVEDFNLMDRKSLLCLLKFQEIMKGDINKKFINVLDEKEMEKFQDIFDTVESVRNSYPERFSKLHPLHCENSNTYATPVSIFHSEDSDRCYYLPLTPQEYISVTNQHKGFSRNEGRVFHGVSPTNTFKFPLDQISVLEEILPENTPTNDELIQLGVIDEDIQPFNVFQLDEFVQKLRSNTPKKLFKELYEHDFEGELVIRKSFRNGTVGFQPQKSKSHWKMVVRSVPVQFLDGESGGVRKVLVPYLKTTRSVEL